MTDGEAGEPASPSGIALCLRVLVEEARSVGLRHTARAITAALLACEMELTLPREGAPGPGPGRLLN